jgi:hypothetical protein
MTNPPTTGHAERHVRLLNRHWAWLEAQPRGVGASLRLLVEAASKDEDGRYRAARIKETCYLYMRDTAGDRPHFEEAARALFANDAAELQRQIASWPLPVRKHIGDLMEPVWAGITTQEAT